MNLFITIVDLTSIFLFTSCSLFFTRKIAKKIGLVDKPNFRKQHQGSIPVVGGISIFSGICFMFIITDYYIPNKTVYLSCACTLVLIGAIDDRFGISVPIRIGVQTVIAIIMMIFGKISLISLGHILGYWDLQLGFFGYFLTILVIWGAINAFNMVDGIDGLLGGLSSVIFSEIGIMLWFNAQYDFSIWCFSMLISMLPYIFLNLGLLGFRYKIFMGDAGSTLIGFTVIWILLETTQGKIHLISPVTALWIVAIPLMDMIKIICHRIYHKKSLFSPDREHTHHLMMRAGFTSHQTFILITIFSAILAEIGIVAECIYCIPEWIMFSLFLFTFFTYSYCINHISKAVIFIKRIRRQIRRISEMILL